MADSDGNLGHSDPDHHQSEVGLARIAAGQLGVVTREQLYDLGFSYQQIKGRLAVGRSHRVHHNVYAVGHPRLTGQASLLAAFLREIDRYWPEHRLAVELDGRPYHLAAGAMERDRIKDASLLKHGITPLRFTDFRVEHDPRRILADLHHFLQIG